MTEGETFGVCDEKDMGEFGIENDKDYKDLKLPPKPVPFYPWNDGDCKRYKGDKADLKARVRNKLYNCWVLWLSLRINKNLDEMLQVETEDKESTEYKLKIFIVHTIDALAKALIDTDILEEIVWLMELVPPEGDDLIKKE